MYKRQYIYRVHPSKIPLKNFEKRDRGRIRGLPNFWGYPLLSQERVKPRTSNSADTLTGSMSLCEQKSIKNFRNSSHRCSQGILHFFRSRIHWAHRAVIFATAARLSCSRFPTYVITIHQRCRQTDGHAISIPRYALCTTVQCASRGKKHQHE